MSGPFELDVCGLSCPEPVIRTKIALDNGKVPLTVLSDSFVSAENIRRLANSFGFKCTTAKETDKFIISIAKEV